MWVRGLGFRVEGFRGLGFRVFMVTGSVDSMLSRIRNGLQGHATTRVKFSAFSDLRVRGAQGLRPVKIVQGLGV